jgi:hypothetical protein
MTTILSIEKTGIIKEIALKTFSEKELYKKAGYKNDSGFACVHQWTIENAVENAGVSQSSDTKIVISVYGKTSGRAGQENKYDFPPPIDNTLFFGTCLLVANVSSENNTCDSLKIAKWNTIYEALFGGFEDIGDEDSVISEDDIDSDVKRTKDGYVKDGFIVDDDSYDSDEDSDDYETDEEDEVPVIIKPAKKPAKSKKVKATVFDKIDTMILTPGAEGDNATAFLDCTSELVEEEYEE